MGVGVGFGVGVGAAAGPGVSDTAPEAADSGFEACCGTVGRSVDWDAEGMGPEGAGEAPGNSSI